MPGWYLLIKPDVFSILALTGMGVGFLIPRFYDWTGSDQSRASPIVGQTAIGLLVVALAICAALPWLPVAKNPAATYDRGSLRFSIRAILIATTAVAAFTAFFPASFLPLLGVASYVVAFGFAVHFWRTFRHFRGTLISLLACMYLPFAWLAGGALSQGFEVLWFAVGLPALIPTFFVSSLVQQHPEQMTWLSSVLTSLELLGGLWLIRLDRRFAIAYHMFALLLSTYGSFALNALLRM